MAGNGKNKSSMEDIRQKIAEIITRTHKMPLEQADEILLLLGVVGRSEQFYCDGQENNKVRCETQCLGCAGMQEIYGQ